MRLTTAQITDFKSIRDSNVIEIDDVTCLVGKNEAGKTAVLEALYRLNPLASEHSTFDVIHDYPRSDVEDYRQSIEKKQRKDAIVVKGVFQLDQSEINSVQREFGASALRSNTVVLSKGYSNTLYVRLEMDESSAVKYLVSECKLPTVIKKEVSKPSTIGALSELLRTRDTAADEKDVLAELTRLKSVIDAISKEDLGIYTWTKHLKATFPKFLYFDEYFQMEGQVNLQRLVQRQASSTLLDSDRPMLGLIELARLNVDRLLSPKNTQELINTLEGTSNHLSKQVLKYWSQNKHLRMKFDVRPATPGDPEGMRDGLNLWASVEDSVHNATTLLGKRSRGFVWFFSFLAYFSQQRKSNQPMILLLDEPGLFLHGTAQADLLRYMEDELKPNHQVIYTTHSPFMVHPERFNRVRIVEDKSLESEEELSMAQRGTKVTIDVLSVGRGSLFPLQHALGFEIAQTLFVGPNCLIVEGVSDLLILQSISAFLKEKGMTCLDKLWVITPVGGADKVPTFVALIGAQKGIRLATLIDIQRKDKQKIENLYKSKLIRMKNVLTFGMFTGVEESDLEDMFEVGFYLDLVNREFASELASPIKEQELSSDQTRITVRLQKYFDSLATTPRPDFNHYRPARFFAENMLHVKDQISEKTINRFDKAFATLNALL
jgi:predicted ATP-dependent endonuclease of OLD family